jgi:hypothetical protein
MLKLLVLKIINMNRFDAVEKIKDYHVRICIGILMLLSLFMFGSGLTFSTIIWPMPWWASLLYGWSGLVVAFKLSDIWYKDKK